MTNFPSRQEPPEGFCVHVGGIPGVGKTTMLIEHAARHRMDEQITGSSIIKSIITPATVHDLDSWPESKRDTVREASIKRLDSICRSCPGRLVLDGHFTLRNRSSKEIESVFTDGDKNFYDALILVIAPAKQILAWRSQDVRKRSPESLEMIREHQSREREAGLKVAKEMNLPIEIIDELEVEARCHAMAKFLDQVCPL